MGFGAFLAQDTQFQATKAAVESTPATYKTGAEISIERSTVRGGAQLFTVTVERGVWSCTCKTSATRGNCRHIAAKKSGR